MDLTQRVLSIGTDRAIEDEKDARQGITPKSNKNGCNGLSEPQNSIPEDKVLQSLADKNEKIREIYKAVISEYGENIRRAKSNRSKLLKGIRAGEPAEEMLLLATGIISDMTGDNVYRDTTQREIEKNYRLGKAV